MDHQTPDSASTASAMFSGIKTNSWTVGYDSTIVHSDPESQLEEHKVKSIIHHAQEAGKDTGIVTSTRITHATPSAMYAHSADRDWECWHDLEKDKVEDKTHDIAWQLMNQEPGKSLKVMLGGGRAAFRPKSEEREITDDDYSWDCHTQERLFSLENVFLLITHRHFFSGTS